MKDPKQIAVNTERLNKIEKEDFPERVQCLEDAQVINTQEHKKIMELLEPISDTYKTVNIVAKWLMAFLVFVSVLFGIIANWGAIIRTLFKK